MDIAQLIRRMGETISATATVRTVFGEPVTSGQRTVLPVATVRFAFGGGGGSHKNLEGGEPRGGGGGGGRVSAQPCGLAEVTPEGARFIYFRQREMLVAAAVIGLLAGFAIGSLRRCREASDSV